MTLPDQPVMLNTIIAVMEGQYVFNLYHKGNVGSAQTVIFEKLLIHAKPFKVGLAF